MHMTNKEIIQSLYQSFASGDVPAVLAQFDGNITWTESDGFPLAGGKATAFLQHVDSATVRELIN
jgi:ketosteroid isomerase-like protein